MFVLHKGSQYCSECAVDSLVACSDCGQMIWENDRCPKCRSLNGVHEYRYKPVPNFYGKSGPYFGIELEVAIKDGNKDVCIEAQKLSKQIRGWAYLKHDGSISYPGFEIVTHPMSTGWIAHNHKTFDQIFDLKNQGFFSPETCGMHIHVSKNDIPEKQIRKILQFFYCSEKNKNFIIAISERGLREFTRWAAFSSYDNFDLDYLSKNKSGGNRGAINLGSPGTPSIEFRIFRGTLNKATFFKNIEFIQALLLFTKGENRNLEDMTITEFCKFVHNRKKQFINLDPFLCGIKKNCSLQESETKSLDLVA